MKYQRKLVEVCEAIQWTGDNLPAIQTFCTQAVVEDFDGPNGTQSRLAVKFRGDRVEVENGSWVLKTVSRHLNHNPPGLLESYRSLGDHWFKSFYEPVVDRSAHTCD